VLPMRVAHVDRLDTPRPSPDPFSRMLVAQALAEGLKLAIKDPALARYGGRHQRTMHSHRRNRTVHARPPASLTHECADGYSGNSGVTISGFQLGSTVVFGFPTAACQGRMVEYSSSSSTMALFRVPLDRSRAEDFCHPMPIAHR